VVGYGVIMLDPPRVLLLGFLLYASSGPALLIYQKVKAPR
jgi:hypothetical protein